MTTSPTSTATTRDEMEVEKKPGTVITCTPDDYSPCTSVQTEDKFYEERPLPPVDRGKEAWLLLAACFVLEAVGWGYIILDLPLRDDRHASLPTRTTLDIDGRRLDHVRGSGSRLLLYIHHSLDPIARGGIWCRMCGRQCAIRLLCAGLVC
ncbi:predicted protein [Aspergillus terreus NIH2624]|uniref:Uncharacterized protein n=1 Tax=Aspergillus terreus (strain NIH 2624 / FGSC A1156) TaxID=341663 RepID=Q0CB57_ASPTN|nr:uncharacterized protein ATEG_09077 [Aspergillus terreus NIH2624]EAU30214.1 predicted protein [Aspergillus terreus NIH2624]